MGQKLGGWVQSWVGGSCPKYPPPSYKQSLVQPAGHVSCEIAVQARGWVQEAFPLHNTMVYSVWRVMVFISSSGTVEGQAPREQSYPSD